MIRMPVLSPYDKVELFRCLQCEISRAGGWWSVAACAVIESDKESSQQHRTQHRSATNLENSLDMIQVH